MTVNTQQDVDVLKVARFMFDRNAEQMGADEPTRDYYWNEDGIKQFWTGEAEAILSFVGFAEPDA